MAAVGDFLREALGRSRFVREHLFVRSLDGLNVLEDVGMSSAVNKV